MLILLSLILLLIITIVLIVLINKRGWAFCRRGITGKVIRVILIVYYVALLFSVMGIYLIKDKSIETYPNQNLRDIVLVQQTQNYFSDRIKDNSIDKAKDINKDGYWEFKYKDSIIHITAPENIFILVQEKAKADGKIEISNYEGKYIVDSVDFTKKVRPPVVNFKTDSLTIENPSKYAIVINKFYQDFTMAQFSGSKNNMFNQGYSGSSIGSILLIKIPQNVKLEMDNIKMNIEYIKD